MVHLAFKHEVGISDHETDIFKDKRVFIKHSVLVISFILVMHLEDTRVIHIISVVLITVPDCLVSQDVLPVVEQNSLVRNVMKLVNSVDAHDNNKDSYISLIRYLNNFDRKSKLAGEKKRKKLFYARIIIVFLWSGEFLSKKQ